MSILRLVILFIEYFKAGRKRSQANSDTTMQQHRKLQNQVKSGINYFDDTCGYFQVFFVNSKEGLWVEVQSSGCNDIDLTLSLTKEWRKTKNKCDITRLAF